MHLETIGEHRCHGGLQTFHRHQSSATSTPMRFSVFTPPGPGPHPVVWYLAGLTGTEETVAIKAGGQRPAAELGLMLVGLDTSPRGDHVANDDAYDMGQGAGFYLDATESPWSPNFRMRSYVEVELPALIAAHFPADMARQGITGHSMGGHGALTVGLRNPERFASISAFAPIVSPMNCPWGDKAFSGYLGRDRSAWRAYDACALIEDGARHQEILIDQGLADAYLSDQLKPELFEAACARAGQSLAMRRQADYDHSYWFVQSFIESHLRWHAARLVR